MKKLFFLLILLPSFAFAAHFTEGKEYQVIANGQTSKGSTPTITEFFSYGCPWCYKMEEPFNAWIKKQDQKVTVARVPVVFKPGWDLYAKAYYTANLLGLSNKFDPLLFKTIQEDKQPLSTNKAMIAFFVAHGVNKETAESAFEHSPTVDMKVSTGMQLMTKYQIQGVPAFVINNRYKTDLQMAGGPDKLFELLSYLLKK